MYRSLAVNENEIDDRLIEDILQYSSSALFVQLEPFFDFLSKSKQLKLVKLFVQQIIDGQFTSDQEWFITTEDRLELIVQAMIDLQIHS